MIGNREKILTILNRLIGWSLYILIFSLPFSKTMIEICAIIAITCWAIKKLFLGKEGLKLARTDLNVPLAIFYLISFLSIFWSTHPDISIKAFIRKLTEYLLIYFIVVETVNERRIVRNMVIALASSAFIICVDSLYQKFTGYDFIRNYPMFGLGRITASFEFPNGLSVWLLIVSFPFISLAFFYKKNLRFKMANSVLAIMLAYCLFLTYTRGASISLLLTFALMLFLMGGKVYNTLFAIFILGIAALILVLPEKTKVLVGLSNLLTEGSGPHRLNIWTAGWKMFINRPFLGQGLNAFMANYERFKLPSDPVRGLWYAHNCYLQIAAEIGIFGLLSFLWMVARTFMVSIKSWRLINDEFLRCVYLGLFCGIVAFLVHISVEMSLYSLQLAVLFYFSLGLLMGIKNIGLNYGKI